MTERDPWNRCDECGRFIALADFDRGAVRRLVYPDSEFTRETWETLCIAHGEQARDMTADERAEMERRTRRLDTDLQAEIKRRTDT